MKGKCCHKLVKKYRPCLFLHSWVWKTKNHLLFACRTTRSGFKVQVEKLKRGSQSQKQMCGLKFPVKVWQYWETLVPSWSKRFEFYRCKMFRCVSDLNCLGESNTVVEEDGMTVVTYRTTNDSEGQQTNTTTEYDEVQRPRTGTTFPDLFMNHKCCTLSQYIYKWFTIQILN